MQSIEKERVRRNTSEKNKERIDRQTFRNIAFYSRQPVVLQLKRITELEKEWDIERMLELNASLFALVGTLLSGRNKRWLLLPGMVTAFLAQHAIQGWCPPLSLFRALGFRTRSEIDQEKYTLKALLENSRGNKSLRRAWADVRNDRGKPGGPVKRKGRLSFG
ncbi:MAG TPA: hypothetical protein VI112_18290 [Bacteroidia bacterium]|jgi:hypothetical protein